MIESIEQLHKVNFLHQDVKVDNFRVRKQDNFVMMIDFGLMIEVYNKGVHKSYSKFGFQGTPHFGSMSSLTGYALSRRDDLECLAYTLMFIINENQIPWKGKEDRPGILQSKKEFMALPEEEVYPYFRGLRRMITRAAIVEFTAEPDYDSFR